MLYLTWRAHYCIWWFLSTASADPEPWAAAAEHLQRVHCTDRVAAVRRPLHVPLRPRAAGKHIRATDVSSEQYERPAAGKHIRATDVSSEQRERPAAGKHLRATYVSSEQHELPAAGKHTSHGR